MLYKISCNIIAVTFMLWLKLADSADLPCLARSVANRSVVCVCTPEYCDTVTREAPVSGRYVTYVSSEAGLRFNKSISDLQKNEEGVVDNIIEVDPTTTFQTITGFGAAVTDAAGINWKSLSDPKLMQSLIESYCGDTGIQYNMLRVPIGGSDFSIRPYSYQDLPEDDETLSNFTLAFEDNEYKIPMIKACMEAASTPIQVLAAMWSPPAWMKTNRDFKGYNRMEKQHLSTLADYFYKFLEKYAEQGISMWSVSLNEPLLGNLDYGDINNLGWTLDYLAEFIMDHLGPKLRNSSFKDVKILAGDDQRYTINIYWNIFLAFYPEALEYLDGVAVHWYINRYTPSSILTAAMADYPDKFVISTEASSGALPEDILKVDPGNWSRAETYFTDIIENFKENVIGWVDWNICLNPEGGPNWTGSKVDSPIIVNAKDGEFYKQPMFYAMGHFSKFVPRGSKRIQTTVTNETNIQNLAFLTPNNTVVVELYNPGAEETFRIRLGEQEAVVKVEAMSFTTIEMLNE